MRKRLLIEGEISVLALITVFCIVVLEESVRVFLKDPVITGSGIVPLFTSIIMLIMIAFVWRETRSFSPIYHEKDGFRTKLRRAINVILPKNTVVSIVFLLLYVIALPILRFNVTTFLFLTASIIVFKGGNLKKAVLVSLGVVAAIIIIFNVLFKVILP